MYCLLKCQRVFPLRTVVNGSAGNSVLSFLILRAKLSPGLCPACVVRQSSTVFPRTKSFQWRLPVILYKNQFISLRLLSTTGGKIPQKEGANEVAGNAEKTKNDEVQPTPVIKVKPKTKKIDYTKSYTQRNFITAVRAMNEYCLKSSNLEGLRTTVRRSPFENDPPIKVYLRSDVDERAMEVWESKEELDKERMHRKQQDISYKEHMSLMRRALREYKSHQEGDSPLLEATRKSPYMFKPSVKSETLSSAKVVMFAITVNFANFMFKVVAWLSSGSSSMFAETVHSLADTCNQLILALGIRQSIKRPSPDHPYGFSQMRYISSLISGVGIFCMGAGLSWYHGIMGLLHPEQIHSFTLSYVILAGSLVTEGATLVVAFRQMRKSAKNQGIPFMQYVLRSRDPSVNVVLLEDTAAVLGVSIAATALALTSITGNPLYDSLGSLGVGGLLATVASFLIYTNTEALVGRSIPHSQKLKLMESMETDRMVRAVYDVKATDLGVDTIRFKAEVDFDGREVTRSYLQNVDVNKLLQEVQQFQTFEEVESFLLKHGENIVDQLGAEVDRIETTLKEKNPTVRHVDLEIL